MEVTDQARPKISSEAIGRKLEQFGWLKSIAGEHDFDVATRGIADAIAKKKGLLLVGEAGVGKTFLLKILQKIYKSRYWLSCSNKMDLYRMQDTDDGFYLDKLVFIDDVGVETEEMINYQKVNCFGKFIQWYYDSCGTGRLYISTNLGSEEINAKYDGRILDRLLDMCIVVKFTGKSKRERNIIA